MKLTKLARCIQTDAMALIATLIIGLVSRIGYHVPLAITLPQLVAAGLVLAYPLSKMSRRKAVLKHPRNQLVIEMISFGILAAAIAYVNYRLFFSRHQLSPAYIDTSHPFYKQATTLALLTLVICQFIHTQFIRSENRKHFFSRQLWSDRQYMRAFAISAFALLNVIYNPWLHGLFGTRALDIMDWLTALCATAAYISLKLLQLHTRQHTRHAVLKLHHQVHKT